MPTLSYAQACSGGSASPAAANTGAAYKTQNSVILGPDGKPFTPAGINVLFGGRNPPAATLRQQFPGINFVRLPVYHYDSPQALASLVNDYTSNGIVVEIENHDNGAGGAGGSRGTIFSGDKLSNELNWYASVASAFKDNPNVWFGTNNEPSQTDASGNSNPAALSDWQLATYNAIRSSGNNSPILLEANGWPEGNRAVVNQGYKASNYAGMTNTILDPHIYGWWTNGSTDQAANDNMVASVIQAAQQLKSADGTMPVIIGEYGPATDGAKEDSNSRQIVQAVQNSGVGTVAWAYMYGDAGSDHLLNDDGSLNWYGQEVANFIQNGSNSCYASAGLFTGTSSPLPQLIIPAPPADPYLPAGPSSDYWSAPGAASPVLDVSIGPNALAGTPDPTFAPLPFLEEPDLAPGEPAGSQGALPPQVIPSIGADGIVPASAPVTPAGDMPPQVIPTISGGILGARVENISSGTSANDLFSGGSGDLTSAIDPAQTPQLLLLSQQSYGTAAINAADDLSINPASVAAIAQAESGFQNVPTANGTTTATGPWQFTQSTFDGVSSANNLGYTSADITDPKAQAVAASYYLQQVSGTISQAMGQPATTLDAYGGWVFGPSAGAQIAVASDNTPLRSLIPATSLSNNGMSDWTVGQFRSAMTTRLGAAAKQTVSTTASLGEKT